MDLKKEWIKITNTLIKEFEDKTKYLYTIKSDINNFEYYSEPSWIYNILEKNNYNESINIKVYKKNNGKYELLREYMYDILNQKVVCYMI